MEDFTKEDRNIELIERYQRDALSEAERASVEQKIAADPSDAASFLAANFEDFQPDLSRRGQEEGTADSAAIWLQNGLDRYENRDYEAAIPLLQRSLSQEESLSDQERYNGLLGLGSVTAGTV